MSVKFGEPFLAEPGEKFRHAQGTTGQDRNERDNAQVYEDFLIPVWKYQGTTVGRWACPQCGGFEKEGPGRVAAHIHLPDRSPTNQYLIITCRKCNTDTKAKAGAMQQLLKKLDGYDVMIPVFGPIQK